MCTHGFLWEIPPSVLEVKKAAPRAELEVCGGGGGGVPRTQAGREDQEEQPARCQVTR